MSVYFTEIEIEHHDIIYHQSLKLNIIRVGVSIYLIKHLKIPLLNSLSIN